MLADAADDSQHGDGKPWFSFSTASFKEQVLQYDSSNPRILLDTGPDAALLAQP